MATELERLVVLIEANTKSYERAMVRMQAQTAKAIRGSQKSIQGLDATLAATTKAAKTFAGVLGAGFLVGGLAQLPGAMADIVKSVADLGDTADKIGITAEQLQELNFQAEQTGSSAEAMTASLIQFSKRLGEARTGTGDLYKLLKANGVALDDLARMDVNEALRVFVDILGRAEDQAAALKMATIAGGKAATDWALTFRGGTTAMKDFADQAHRTAQIMTNETVESAKELDDKFAVLLGTISQIVKSGVVDAFGDIADEIDRINGPIETLQTFGARARSQPNPFNATVEEFEEYGKVAQKIDDAFQSIGQQQRDPELRRALERKLSIAPGGDESLGKSGKPSVLPPPPPAAKHHDAAAAAVKKHKEAVVELIAELQRELSLVGQSETAQRISNELHRAGAEATAAQKQQITDLVTKIEAETKAQDDLIDRLDEIRNAAGGALDAFAQSIANSEGPLAALKASLVDLLQTIIRIGEQQAILRLFGAAGTSGGGFIAPIISAVTGGGAQKVNVNVTASPLLHAVVNNGARQAEERAISRGPAVARNNNRRYATP